MMMMVMVLVVVVMQMSKHFHLFFAYCLLGEHYLLIFIFMIISKITVLFFNSVHSLCFSCLIFFVTKHSYNFFIFCKSSVMVTVTNFFPSSFFCFLSKMKNWCRCSVIAFRLPVTDEKQQAINLVVAFGFLLFSSSQPFCAQSLGTQPSSSMTTTATANLGIFLLTISPFLTFKCWWWW